MRLNLSLLILSTIFLLSCNQEDESIVDNYVQSRQLVKKTNEVRFDGSKINSFRLKYDMTDVEEIASLLAKSLKDKDIRYILWNSIKISTYREQILEASEFFNKQFSISKNGKTKHFTFLEKMLEKCNPSKRTSFQNKIENLDFGAFDVYFPFLENRNTWNGEKEILVAPVNSCIAKGDDLILAFNQEGKEVYLKPKQVPEIPTLVVCPSEKYGIYEKELPENNMEPSASIKSAGGSYYYRSFISLIYIYHQYDGDFCGTEMEIYFKTRYNDGNGYTVWNTTGTHDVLPNAGKFIDQTIINYGPTGEQLTAPYKIQVEIWEDDDWLCGSDDFVADVTYNKLNWWTYPYGPWVYLSGPVTELVYRNAYKYELVDGLYPDDTDKIQIDFETSYY